MAVVRLALPVATHQLFDYWLPNGLAVAPGSVLRATLGGGRIVGVAVEIVEKSEVAPEKLLPIEEVLNDVPALPEDLRRLAGFIASYYQQPIGLCFGVLLPPLGATRGTATGRARRYRLSACGQGEPAPPG